MPELAEVETVCRSMRRCLDGKKITHVEVVSDPLVFSKHSKRDIEEAMSGGVVREIGRRGKTFWISMKGRRPTVYGHLGMSGWIREVGVEGTRLRGHGDAPFDDGEGRPRFLKMLIEVRGGRGIAFTDPRRLGRIWLGDDPSVDSRMKRLGRDAYDDLPTVEELMTMFGRRHIAIKAVLLDQSALAGIGNWLADEILYQSRIAPQRVAADLSKARVSALREAITYVVGHAVKVGADSKRFPKTWLFEHRWGGSRGAQTIGRHPIRRDEVGGRTTAWVPAVQR